MCRGVSAAERLAGPGHRAPRRAAARRRTASRFGARGPEWWPAAAADGLRDSKGSTAAFAAHGAALTVARRRVEARRGASKPEIGRGGSRRRAASAVGPRSALEALAVTRAGGKSWAAVPGPAWDAAAGPAGRGGGRSRGRPCSFEETSMASRQAEPLQRGLLSEEAQAAGATGVCDVRGEWRGSAAPRLVGRRPGGAARRGRRGHGRLCCFAGPVGVARGLLRN